MKNINIKTKQPVKLELVKKELKKLDLKKVTVPRKTRGTGYT